MFERAIQNLEPRPRSRVLDWSRANVQDSYGAPYDHAAFPHSGAPGGPFDAFDCPQYRTIIMQFASQIAKTFSGICCLLKTADTNPCPMMFASSDKKLATEEIRTKFYPMLERCVPLRGQVRPKTRQKQDLVELDNCRVFVSWSRSVSTLASKSILVGMGNEIDKWEHPKTAKEADPLELFMDRFKRYPSHKIILESTPALKSKSRIERLRLTSTNCSYWVPCPHCGKRQVLKFTQMKWEHTEGGKSDSELARKTAYYECAHCQGKVKDEHRGTMMRGGVWIPEGCGCDDEKAAEAVKRTRQPGAPIFRGWSQADWVTGLPARDGRQAGFHLSSLYALSLSWGEIAEKFVLTKSRPGDLQNFVNQWLGETWERVERRTTWQQLGEKLIDRELKRFAVPSWASLITVGIDAQEDGNRLPFVVAAWGPERKHAVIGYGEAESLADIERLLLDREFDGLKIKKTLIDSGNRPRGYYEWCLAMAGKGFDVLPCKGSSTSLEADYVISKLGENTAMPGMLLVRVDTIRTQVWIDRVLHVLGMDDAGGGRLHADSIEVHQDFLEQVLNDGSVIENDRSNNPRESWSRIEENVPNDFRDAWRYAYVAMLIETRNGPIPPRSAEKPKQGPAVLSMGRERPNRW